MFVETPQILWNPEGDRSVNAALLSVSVIQSGLGVEEEQSTAAVVSAATGGQEAGVSATTVSSAAVVGGVTSTQAAAMASAGGSTSRQQQQLGGHVLVTAGNSPLINLWKVSFPSSITSTTSDIVPKDGNETDTTANTNIQFVCSLSRHDAAVNAAAFSPDGLHLATGSATGALIVWSVPLSKRGGGNGRHYWSMIQGEVDLSVKIVNNGSTGICDISWSSDSKRFMVGTIDHSMIVVENANHASLNDAVGAGGSGGGVDKDADWRTVYTNGMDHTNFVNGTSYDPQGVYLATMSNDRSVRVHARKAPKQPKPSKPKSVLKQSSSVDGSNNSPAPCANGESTMTATTTTRVHTTYSLLTDSKFDMSRSSKQVKFRKSYFEDGSCLKQHLYADESTLESFVRRLAWTADGAFLITPAAVWHNNNKKRGDDGSNNKCMMEDGSNGNSTHKNDENGSDDNTNEPSFATCLFARHRWEEPCRVLQGLEKPSIAVRPNPVLFQLPQQQASTMQVDDNESKENKSPKSLAGANSSMSSTSSRNDPNCAHGLPYRNIFAVLTWDSVLIYDTYHTNPLAIVKGLHYCQIVDATWTADGHNLIVCSTDGYISFIRFTPEELGPVYTPPLADVEEGIDHAVSPTNTNSRSNTPVANNRASLTSASGSSISKPSLPQPSPNVTLPPCDPGMATVEVPPAKKSKTSHNGQHAAADEIGHAVDKLSLHHGGSSSNANKHQQSAQDQAVVNELQPKKKKKRVQPILMTTQ